MQEPGEVKKGVNKKKILSQILLNDKFIILKKEPMAKIFQNL